MALETGGRLTRNSNDLALGYVRARDDLACRYTLAFYDRKPEENKRHDVSVKAVRSGLRVLHASAYAFPSRSVKREATLSAAYLAPDLFAGGGVNAGVVPVAPLDSRTWSCDILVDFPVALAGAEGGRVSRELGAVLRKGPDIVHQFSRKVTVRAKRERLERPDRTVSFLEHADLPPGKYSLTAVVADSEEAVPFAAPVEVTIPAIPDEGPFVVGPVLGRRSDGDVVVRAATPLEVLGEGRTEDHVEKSQAFKPLLGRRFDPSETIVALTQVCVRPGAPAGTWTLERILSPRGGPPIGRLTPFRFSAEPGTKFDCRATLDTIELGRLIPGEYRLEVFLGDGNNAPASAASVSFEVMPHGVPPVPAESGIEEVTERR